MAHEISLELGAHLCVFYDKTEQQTELMAAFLREGLKTSEKLVGVLPPGPRKEVEEKVFSGDLQYSMPPWKKKIQWLKPEDLFLQKGVMAPEKFLETITSMTKEAARTGFSGIRLATDFGKPSQKWANSRAILDQEIRWEREKKEGLPCTAMCLYDLGVLAPAMIRPLANIHPQIAFASDWYDGFMADPVFHLEKTGMILHANRAARKLFSYCDWGAWVNFFDFVDAPRSRELFEQLGASTTGAQWNVIDEFLCGGNRRAWLTWKMKETWPGIYSAYCERVEWTTGKHTHASPCSFCAIDMVENTEVEVLKSKRDEKLKFRFHELPAFPGKYLILGASFSAEARHEGCKILKHIDQPIYERTVNPDIFPEPFHWVEWVRGQEVNLGIATPLNLWVGIWDTKKQVVNWAGDGLPVSWMFPTPGGTAAFCHNHQCSSGSWPVPNSRDGHLIFSGESAALSQEMPFENTQTISQLLETSGTELGHMVVRLKHLGDEVGRARIHSVFAIGELLSGISEQGNNAGWTTEESQLLLLEVSHAVMSRVQWDETFVVKESLLVEWEIGTRGLWFSLRRESEEAFSKVFFPKSGNFSGESPLEESDTELTIKSQMS